MRLRPITNCRPAWIWAATSSANVRTPSVIARLCQHEAAQGELVAGAEHAPAGPPGDGLSLGADLGLGQLDRHRRSLRSSLSCLLARPGAVGTTWWPAAALPGRWAGGAELAEFGAQGSHLGL